MAKRPLLAVLAAITCALGGLAVVAPPAQAAGPRPLFQLPFQCGQRWQLSTYPGHDDYDIDMIRVGGTTAGQDILASYGGTVEFAGWDDGAGNYVKINHGSGWQTMYLHMVARPVVSTGQRVVQGQLLGRVGSTGRSSGPHMHHEQRRDGQKVESWFDGVPSGITSDDTSDEVIRTSNNCPESQNASLQRGVSAVMHGSVLRAFARGNDGALWQNYWADGTWTWQRIGGAIVGAPAAVYYDGLLRVFARGTDGALWQYYWTGSEWKTQDLGGTITSAPAAVVQGDMLRVFARGNDGALWQNYLVDGHWTWQDLGGGISSAPTALMHGNVVRLFARGNDGSLWQNYLVDGHWTWQDLGGGISSAPSAVLDGSMLRVFARGDDGSLWQNYYTGGQWAWQDLGGAITSAPGAVMHGNVPRVFARGADGALWQDYLVDGHWTWQDLGGGIS
ncbi:peptidoglycan DD-metalloendopeptidase family protein [Micromonospora sp. NPDC048835]|uniref:peptidoglycan DD-metalloendopeptidase family protein n=1 Tax=Micromonospora sp. NPDC048835 TaxID=3155147 RepID=UPI0033F04F50